LKNLKKWSHQKAEIFVFRASFKSNIGIFLKKVYKKQYVNRGIVRKYVEKVAGDSRYLQAI